VAAVPHGVRGPAAGFGDGRSSRTRHPACGRAAEADDVACPARTVPLADAAPAAIIQFVLEPLDCLAQTVPFLTIPIALAPQLLPFALLPFELRDQLLA
jgi:hypothetical protein